MKYQVSYLIITWIFGDLKMAILGFLSLFRIAMLAIFEVGIKKYRRTISILPGIFSNQMGIFWTIFGQPRRYLTKKGGRACQRRDLHYIYIY